MKKALIVISSDIYIRNYLRTKAFKELSEHLDCEFIADSGVNNKSDLEELAGFRGYFDIAPRMRDLHSLHFSLMMWRFRKRSKTFTYRWMRNSGWHTIKRSGPLFPRFLSFVIWLIKASANPQGLRIPFLANPLIYPVSIWFLRQKLRINRQILDFFDSGEYHVCLFPSSAFDAAAVDTTRVARIKGVPSICLIDNWDNLTSKTVFWELPDFIGVWGAQAKRQAVDIHGFEPEQVALLGTPRFDSYYEYRNQPSTSHYEFPYVLFVGSAMPFDELGALRRLEQIILGSDRSKDSLRIVYRPHPWQQKRQIEAKFDEEDFSIVSLDSQMRKAYEQGVRPEKTDEKFQPDLSYYPSLLHHARVVIGPLTTMLLEAALSLRPVIGLSYFDGHHLTTSLRYFSHFQGTEQIPGFTLCHSPDTLQDLLVKALASAPISGPDSDQATQFFVYRDSRPYSQRISDLTKKVASAF